MISKINYVIGILLKNDLFNCWLIGFCWIFINKYCTFSFKLFHFTISIGGCFMCWNQNKIFSIVCDDACSKSKSFNFCDIWLYFIQWWCFNFQCIIYIVIDNNNSITRSTIFMRVKLPYTLMLVILSFIQIDVIKKFNSIFHICVKFPFSSMEAVKLKL